MQKIKLWGIFLFDKIKEDQKRSSGSMAGMIANEYKIYLHKSEDKRPIGRHRHRCETNIKTFLK